MNEEGKTRNEEIRTCGRADTHISAFFILLSAFRKKSLNLVQYTLLLAVRLYRWTLSPAMTFLFGPFSQCRFTPSCSQYAGEAIQTHGSAAGSWLAVKRICRCHPWGGCGHDPVPGAEGRRQKVEGRSEETKRLAGRLGVSAIQRHASHGH